MRNKYSADLLWQAEVKPLNSDCAYYQEVLIQGWYDYVHYMDIYVA